MKKYLTRILVVLLFLAGLGMLMYPMISNMWNNHRQNVLMSSYENSVKEKEDSGEIDYEAEWQKAYDFNNGLLPSILPDSFAIGDAAGEQDEAYMSCLNIAGDSTMGIIEIPKIDVKLPILHTTTDEVLEKAAGHLEGSSLPVGGENTHAVISAHRGLPSATLFTNLDKLEIGDNFYIHVLDDTLQYEVDQIETVEPDDTSLLMVEKGQDLVTLLTCTPYGVNTHRLLVRGHRVPYNAETMEEEAKNSVGSLRTNYVLWVVVGLAITAVFIVLLAYRERKRAKKSKKKTKKKTSGSKKKTSEKKKTEEK